MLVTLGRIHHTIKKEGGNLLLIEYKDMIAQLKYPGASRCMSEIYQASNMPELHYSYDLTASNYPRRKSDDDMAR